MGDSVGFPERGGFTSLLGEHWRSRRFLSCMLLLLPNFSSKVGMFRGGSLNLLI